MKLNENVLRENNSSQWPARLAQENNAQRQRMQYNLNL